MTSSKPRGRIRSREIETRCKGQNYLLFQELCSHLLTMGLPSALAAGMLSSCLPSAKAITVCLYSSLNTVQEIHRQVHSVPEWKPHQSLVRITRWVGWWPCIGPAGFTSRAHEECVQILPLTRTQSLSPLTSLLGRHQTTTSKGRADTGDLGPAGGGSLWGIAKHTWLLPSGENPRLPAVLSQPKPSPLSNVCGSKIVASNHPALCDDTSWSLLAKALK